LENSKKASAPREGAKGKGYFPAASIKVGVIIAAAGSGERFGKGTLKQLSPILGEPIVAHSTLIFVDLPFVEKIVVLAPEGSLELFKGLLSPMSSKIEIRPGGTTRGKSVLLGLNALPEEINLILIHDGVRPLAEAQLAYELIVRAQMEGAAIAAVPVFDTLKRSIPGPRGPIIEGTVSREGMWRAQTPQCFQRELLVKALKGAIEQDLSYTDEASLMETIGVKAALVKSSQSNIKITTPEDLELARALMGQRASAQALRVGEGWDFHSFSNDARPLMLGCVHFPGYPGLSGHSDADVLTHALIDALLGAAALGDIGQIFPATDPTWRGAAGELLLKEAYKLVSCDWELVNADLTLIGEKPIISPMRPLMEEKLCQILELTKGTINIKGKTTEKMGFLGRGEGLAASAIVLIKKKGKASAPLEPPGSNS
jgi:2-C-methyl-D-erythritol 4-phosphate cytidylyltransferase/2-C-methyl-D-erythritol 2,4-cyclodiphosphate synthase